jgi:hypothetical protein
MQSRPNVGSIGYSQAAQPPYAVLIKARLPRLPGQLGWESGIVTTVNVAFFSSSYHQAY